MVDFSFIVSLYVSDLPNVTISTAHQVLMYKCTGVATKCTRTGYMAMMMTGVWDLFRLDLATVRVLVGLSTSQLPAGGPENPIPIKPC